MDIASLPGQVVVVTGASSGIGAAITRSLVAAGATVILAARRVDRIGALAAELGERATAAPCDVTSEADVEALVAATIKRHGRVDGLVNNAGVGSFAEITETTLETWQRTFDVNVTGTFLCSRAVLPGMYERGDGWIVNVCSDVSKRTFAAGGSYCSSKFAQYALSLTLGQEGRPRGVRVGAILPGMVASEFAGAVPEAAEQWVLRPEDVSDAVLFMASRPPHAVVDELTVHPVRQQY